jgi:hypothetical protein
MLNNLAIAMKDPKELTYVVAAKHKFRLKGTGTITFHLEMVSLEMRIIHCAFHPPNKE